MFKPFDEQFTKGAYHDCLVVSQLLVFDLIPAFFACRDQSAPAASVFVDAQWFPDPQLVFPGFSLVGFLKKKCLCLIPAGTSLHQQHLCSWMHSGSLTSSLPRLICPPASLTLTPDRTRWVPTLFCCTMAKPGQGLGEHTRNKHIVEAPNIT